MRTRLGPRRGFIALATILVIVVVMCGTVNLLVGAQTSGPRERLAQQSHGALRITTDQARQLVVTAAQSGAPGEQPEATCTPTATAPADTPTSTRTPTATAGVSQ